MIKLAICFLITLIITACTPPQPFEEGQREYVAGNYITAAEIFSQYTSLNSDNRYEAMYYEGLCMYKIKNYKRAKKLFTGVIEHSHNRKIKAQAIDVKAEMLMKQGDCLAAESLYKMLAIGYNDVYPQNDAYAKLDSVATLCGVTNAGEELVNLSPALENDFPSTSATLIKRVRIDTHFTEKDEAVTVMNTLRDAAIESTLIKVQSPDNTHYLVQVGAFASADNATARAIQVKNMGWKVVIVE